MRRDVGTVRIAFVTPSALLVYVLISPGLLKLTRGPNSFFCHWRFTAGWWPWPRYASDGRSARLEMCL